MPDTTSSATPSATPEREAIAFETERFLAAARDSLSDEMVSRLAGTATDAMDLIVQKATELGVTTILGVHTEFSVVRLDAERRERKLSHWQRIATSACEQSGRHRPPALELHDSLPDAIAAVPDGMARIALRMISEMAPDSPGAALAERIVETFVAPA